jgi:acyl-homoserine lactone synthase
MYVIHLVTPENDYRYRAEMQQACRLRHQVFVEEMSWIDLAKPDGREIDQFDNKHAVHMLYIEHGQVLGYQRMLPSTRPRPHQNSEIMPELCQGDLPVGPHIWECTRHRVANGHREEGRVVSPITNALMSGVVEWGLECGISTLIAGIEPSALLRFVQLHFQPMPLGLPTKIGGRDVIAVTLTFDGRTLERLREMRGTRKTVLAESFERPALLHA